MNENEKLGWIGMSLGLKITALSFILPSLNGQGIDPKYLIVSTLGLIIFLIGLVKGLPEILSHLFTKQQNPNEVKQE